MLLASSRSRRRICDRTCDWVQSHILDLHGHEPGKGTDGFDILLSQDSIGGQAVKIKHARDAPLNHQRHTNSGRRSAEYEAFARHKGTISIDEDSLTALSNSAEDLLANNDARLVNAGSARPPRGDIHAVGTTLVK
jgi:hypothetical protein